MTVNVFPVSSGTVQFTGSGERMIICSGDFTLVGSGGLFTTGSSSIHGLTAVADTGCVCDGGVDATLESPPVTSPFTCGSAVTGTFHRRFSDEVHAALPACPPPGEACTRCIETSYTISSRDSTKRPECPLRSTQFSLGHRV